MPTIDDLRIDAEGNVYFVSNAILIEPNASASAETVTTVVGPQGPQGELGPHGIGIDGIVLAANTGVLTFHLTDNTSIIAGTIPAGPQGISGPTGNTGPKGDTGSQGPDGPQGPQGPIGNTGVQGETGSQGITGNTGPQGPPGDQGPPGVQGTTGSQGPVGNTGVQGDVGPQGNAGVDGANAYVIAVEEESFSGNVSTWLASLVGPQGADSTVPGPQGDLGPVGPQGNAGVDGANAYTIAVTEEAFSGNVSTWLASLVGPQGDQGEPGIQGNTGTTGDTGPAGSQGNAGVDGANAYVIAVEDGFVGNTTSWLLTLVGPQGADSTVPGPQGNAGATGPQGPIGNTGAQGNAGIQGPIGNTGSTGLQGPIGNTGAQGNAGVQGPIGNTGATGSTGPQGNAGVDGANAYQVAVTQGFSGNVTFWLTSLVGAQGPQGNTGAQGPIGNTGATGATGNTGSTGLQGPIGNTGLTGATGPQGNAGVNGANAVYSIISPLGLGTTNAVGVANVASREDHVHQFPLSIISNTIITANGVLTVIDHGRVVEWNSGNGSLILPNTLFAGFNCLVRVANATGIPTFVANTGTTIRQADGFTKGRKQWSEISVTVRTANGTVAEYVLSGDMS
jgi:collagen type VII alpha